MPRNNLTREEIKIFVQKLKTELYSNHNNYSQESKHLANLYLNKILDRVEEFRY